MNSVVDPDALEEGGAGDPFDVAGPVELPRAPQQARPTREFDPRRWLVRIAMAIGVLIVALWIFEKMVTPLLYQQRQLHQAASFATPKPAVVSGDAVAVLQIPTLGVNDIVINDATSDHLRGGPALLRGSALPGDAGVMVVYGHRSAYGGPFENLGKLVAKDQIVIQARNGPIVKYIVDRVERTTRLASVDLGAAGGAGSDLSYLLLVTSEKGWTNGDQLVVVARSLPVTDAEAVVPDLASGPPRELPIGIDALLAAAALAAAALSWGFLRRRANVTVCVLAVSPMVLFAVIRLLLQADTILPFTR